MAFMAYSWNNKVVIITGAATGIGLAVLKIIVNENIKHVAVLDVDEAAGKLVEKELNTKHGNNKVKFYKCDVTNDEIFLGIFDTVKKEQGRIDVLVNNAGIMNDSFHLLKKQIEINVTALVFGTLKAIELMSKENGGQGGTVINISSIAGLHQSPLLPIYFATKSAVLQFSNCIGMDHHYSKSGVRVLAICFGATTTSLLSAQKLGSFDPNIENTLEKMIKEYPQQSVDVAAQGLVDAYKQGQSGSTWLIANGKPAENITSNITKAYEIMSIGM